MLQCSCCICFRLIDSNDDISDTLADTVKKAEYSDEEVEELNTRLAKDLTFQKHKYKSKSEILHRRNDLYDSDSDIDPEETTNTNENSSIEYKSNGYQTSLSKYAKKQFNKTFDSVIRSEYNSLDVAEQSVGRLKDAQLQRMSDNISDDNIENTEVPQQSLNSNKMWLDKRQLLESNEIDDSSIDIKKEDCAKEEETKYLEDELVYADMSCSKIYHDTDDVCEEMKDLPSSEEKRFEKGLQQVYEKEFTVNCSDRSNQPMHNLEKEYFTSKADEMPGVIYHSDEETSNKNDIIEIQNKLNALEDEALPNNVPQNEQGNGAKNEVAELKQASDKKKIINYNKEKLLATIKAIDDNENIEFLSQGFRNHNVTRMQIMENLHRGLPAHSKPKRDIIRDIFEDNHIESKVRGTCSKSH